MKKILIGLFIILNTFTPQYVVLNSAVAIEARAEKVAFNTKTYKVHKLSCPSAQVCTVNCVTIERKEAYQKGGIPCKKCGG
ncbi:MAG: hypothetical protein WCY19_06760 [Candidatus Gastranaerophilaceae bacterium]